MRTRRSLGVGVAAAVVMATLAAPAAGQGGGSEKPKETEVGVSADEIRIAVVADDENQLAPGLFHGPIAAVQAFAKYINRQGGLAGRKVVVDVIDSHLSADDARNAIIQACSEDFALVGTAALFLNNMDDAEACADINGDPTGIPDLASISVEQAEQCSPVTFGVNPPQLDCSTLDQTPQTFRANQGPVKYYRIAIEKDLHGVFVYSNDLKSATVGSLSLARGSQAAGVESDAEIGVSARAPQSAYTPAAQAIKENDSNYAANTTAFNVGVAFRKEAKLQGVDSANIVWDCWSNCYDKRFIEQGGADVEGQYLSLAQLPFEDRKHNKQLASYVKFAGADEVDGFGAYGWLGGLLLRDAVNAIVERDGVNGLTRAALLEQLRDTHAFNGDGMFGTVDVGNRVPTPCFLVMQVKNGKFTRVYPKKPGTFDCKKSNNIEVDTNLLNA
jgi:ABC-type branched-subunit amino acid transport system substrate-binding protein